jgi:hypothetical protein
MLPVVQEGSYAEERALLELENKDSLEVHFANVAIHQMRDQTEERLRQIIARQEEQLRLLMQEKELLATQVITLEGRVRELNETHKKEIWQLKVNPIFKDINELVKALLEISDQHKQDNRYNFFHLLAVLGGSRDPKNQEVRRMIWRPTWTDDFTEVEYRDIVESLLTRTKHLPRSQLNEAMKVVYESTYNRSVYEWAGWDVPIKTLTEETIQILKEHTHK